MGGPHTAAQLHSYVRPTRPITSNVTTVEHAQITELARRHGKTPTGYVTDLVRSHLAAQPMMQSRKVESAEVA